MDESFDGAWNDIQSRLRAGTAIRVWSYVRGYGLNNSFRVEDVERDAITVSSGGTTVARRITRQDFAKVYLHWADFRIGRYLRHLIRDISQNSTYIIGILKWREEDQEAVPAR